MEQYMTGNNSALTRYCVIHGHFYQPPRENPWLDLIESQPSAAPFHDWNERIYDQCYRPNAYSRVLNENGMIQQIYNNYLSLSFNFGPTLFRWIEKKHPETAQRIIEADRASVERLAGHGNAMAQVYNHMIMPLASRRDKLTQIRWAKQFFKSRFGRESEGLWLAETAINMETVECCIEEGIRFVILAPTQAEAFRILDSDAVWMNTMQTPLDIRRPYRIFAESPDNSRNGSYLDVFFFDEALSRGVSFENMLIDSNILAGRIGACYDENVTNQLVTIATDGETFGHHKPFGDMCLAYFFLHTAEQHNIKPVNFAYYLHFFPPIFEVRLKNAFGEGTAWSCAHGVGRWSRNCGCSTGGPAKWNQEWRTPLRAALDRLQKRLDEQYAISIAPLQIDPWKLRDAYFECLDKPIDSCIEMLLAAAGGKATLAQSEITHLTRLLQAQKNILFSFTSCGWFFSDITGIETVQNIAYACRAIQLGIAQSEQQQVFAEFIDTLKDARSNLPDQNGKTLLETLILPQIPNLQILVFTAVAEKIIASLKKPDYHYGDYTIILELVIQYKERSSQVHIFSAAIRNAVTGEENSYSVIFNQYGLICGWVLPAGIINSSSITPETVENWKKSPQALMLNLNSLYSESKRELARFFKKSITQETENAFFGWVTKSEEILESLCFLETPLPAHIAGPIDFILTSQWNRQIHQIKTGALGKQLFQDLLKIWKKAEVFGVALDFSESIPILESLIIGYLNALTKELNLATCDRIRFLLNIVDRFKIPMPKNRIEDAFYRILNQSIRELYNKALHSEKSTPDERIILFELISFARRINFSTVDFPIGH